MIDTRPSWDQIWMEMAFLIAKRSVDPRHQVGCVIVTQDNTQLLSLGYNGNYRGGPNEVESLTPGESGFIHAEENALIKAAYYHPQQKRMYITLQPCRHCAKLLVNANISEVIYSSDYRDPSSLELLMGAGVLVRKFNPN